MGNSLTTSDAPITYAVQTEDPPFADASGVYRCAQYPDALVENMPDRDWKNPLDCMASTALDPEMRDKEFLGSRVWDCALQRSREDMIPQSTVSWVTYGEFMTLVQEFARGLERRGYTSVSEFPTEAYEPARRVRMMGLVSKNRPEWFISEQAAVSANYCLVPLYDSLGSDALHQILDQTKMELLVASRESFRVLQPMIASIVDTQFTSHIKYVVMYDKPSEEDLEKAKEIGAELIDWKDVVQEGRDHPEIDLPTQQPEDLTTVCYTSGTTGAPKGVMMTAHNYTSLLSAHRRCIMSHPGFRIGQEDTHISYLPLAHVFERIICGNCFVLGVKIACYSGDTQKLLDDMKYIQPTIFLSVPRLYMRIHDKIISTLNEKSNVAKFIFETAMNTKLQNLREKGIYTHPLWDALVFKKTKAVMGGRIRFMLVGGAPIEAKVQEEVSVIFCCPVLHGFGMTEVGPVFICNPGDKIAGHIGGVQPCCQFALRSVPETGYFVSGPQCRGQLCIKGPSVTPGYLERPDLTAEVLENGWFHTGDIVELIEGNAIKIIDRQKNIFKLSQGEYVAPEKLENIYSSASLVSQIMVYGDSSKSALVAIVVPDEEETSKWCALNNLQGKSLDELCARDDFKQAVFSNMQEVEKANQVTGFQKVKKIVITPDPFTVENRMLTPTLKLRRAECKKRFEREIIDLYNQL
ncbi:putative long-chain-fatty-acid-CoA ligase [Gregarina niphandrodes]|uniref:Long-chain-fatty-acid-CoA ligase n=1 Tax=Gregarina niphandrodes TaxID=110365 RepID=A0A023B226_GRENI|nr:putative long-chain-fatty-acid-CoA ligase [Gregarina niphandrodes]EZG50579.1 putative long-chain-fatty-acid-CoA ligase [Gregarina niphandrodes]|eukprot:XP_011132008.1 putative long-chain-fatty-acid-CoA ligase [Gregarina niphandrodes]